MDLVVLHFMRDTDGSSGEMRLFHDGSLRLSTKSYGVGVSGTITDEFDEFAIGDVINGLIGPVEIRHGSRIAHSSLLMMVLTRN